MHALTHCPCAVAWHDAHLLLLHARSGGVCAVENVMRHDPCWAVHAWAVLPCGMGSWRDVDFGRTRCAAWLSQTAFGGIPASMHGLRRLGSVALLCWSHQPGGQGLGYSRECLTHAHGQCTFMPPPSMASTCMQELMVEWRE